MLVKERGLRDISTTIKYCSVIKIFKISNLFSERKSRVRFSSGVESRVRITWSRNRTLMDLFRLHLRPHSILDDEVTQILQAKVSLCNKDWPVPPEYISPCTLHDMCQATILHRRRVSKCGRANLAVCHGHNAMVETNQGSLFTMIPLGYGQKNYSMR